MNEIYNKIVEIIKEKAEVFNGTYLNYATIKISPSKTLIYDLDSGGLHTTITNGIRKETDRVWYYISKDEPHPNRIISELKQLLNEIEI